MEALKEEGEGECTEVVERVVVGIVFERCVKRRERKGVCVF
jgi:hypothetical protein